MGVQARGTASGTNRQLLLSKQISVFPNSQRHATAARQQDLRKCELRISGTLLPVI